METGKKRALIFSASITVFTLSACFCSAAEIKRMRLAMGTLLEISAQSENEESAAKAVDAAFLEVDRLDRMLSNYKEDSEISNLNRTAYPHGASVSAEMAMFLLRSVRLSQLSGGAFDVTVEPLSRLWGLRQRSLVSLPSQADIDRTKEKVGYKSLQISDGETILRFLKEGMGIDTGAIGKGYALDMALKKMREFPVSSCALNFGGEILYWSETPSRVEVRVKNPLDPDHIWTSFILNVSSLCSAVSTSANYERYVTDAKDSKKLSHILDPESGRPVEGNVQSVTVLSDNATDADALGCATFVMGLKKGGEFTEHLKNHGVLILYTDNDGALKSYYSKNWTKFAWKRDSLKQ